MRKKLIEMISKMTVADFKDINEFQKAHELMILLKGEPKKRAKRTRTKFPLGVAEMASAAETAN
jgi:hypothetical protein